MSDRRSISALLCLACSFASIAVSACAARHDAFAYSGTVQADAAGVGSTAGGRVAEVLASDGQRVAKGALLVRFDDRQQVAAYRAALAQEAQAAASLRDLEAGPREADVAKAAASAAQAQAVYRRAQLELPSQIASARQSVHAAQAEANAAAAAATTASRDFSRARQLYDQGAVPAQQLDAAQAAAASAQSASAAAQARLRSAESALSAVRNGAAEADVSSAAGAAAAAEANLDLVRVGARTDQVAAAQAALAAATADVAAAAARLDDAHVRSPADGIVDQLDLHPGDLVNPGAPVATIDEFGDPWVRIYVTQTDMQRVRAGATVSVRSDALAGRTFSGRVEAIDAQAQFTPRDVQTAQDRADLAFGVKVRIRDPDRFLRAGTTVDVALP